MGDLVGRGAEVKIVGCTEICLPVAVDECRAPVFVTTRIHAEAAVDLALADE
jgi:aspartate racemase